MQTKETPKALYVRIEERLSPLLRQLLAESLPKIGGQAWWKTCVQPALTAVQLDHVRPEKTLEQFDYPALVSILYRNWRSLRPLLGIGDELTNYLFTIKTFRTDAQHQPDLVLTDARREHILQAADLAESLLTGKKQSPTKAKNRYTPALVLGSVIALFALGTAVMLKINSEEAAKSADALANAVQRVALAGDKPVNPDFLKNLPVTLKKDEILICLRYLRADGSWSKYYTTKGFIQTGAALNGLLGENRFDEDRRHLIVHWRKSDDHTVILLNTGETRPADMHTDYRDTTLRQWQVKAGWDGCPRSK